ncbi:hypothetical protein BDR05DRAFT_952723, partial [Suillus weaverae]
MPVPPRESLEPVPRVPSPHPFRNEDTEHDVDMDGYHGDMDEHLHQPSPCADVDTEFFGHGDHLYRNYHIGLNGRTCDVNGVFLPPGAPPPPPENLATDDWTPFQNCSEFEMAEFLYKHNQMPAGQIDHLLDLWASTLAKHNDNLPFADHRDLYHVIDSSSLGDVPWQCFMVVYDGERLADEDKPWMDAEYEVWFRDPREVAWNMLVNLTYANEIDYCPYWEYSTEGDKCQWRDFMSGDWVWDQADEITKDLSTLGSTFVPVILGSDKMTVSVGTGNNEYYWLYASIGNIHNNIRRVHRDGMAIIGFLAMPKIAAIIICIQIQLVNMVRKPGPQQPKAQWNSAKIEAFLTYLISVKSTMAGTNFKEVTFNAAAQEIASKQTSGPPKTGAQCKNKWGSLKLVYNAIEAYCNKSGCHWDNNHRANIEGSSAEAVWDEYVSKKTNALLKPFKTIGWPYFSMMEQILPNHSSAQCTTTYHPALSAQNDQPVASTSSAPYDADVSISAGDLHLGVIGAGMRDANPMGQPHVILDLTPIGTSAQAVINWGALPPIPPFAGHSGDSMNVGPPTSSIPMSSGSSTGKHSHSEMTH